MQVSTIIAALAIVFVGANCHHDAIDKQFLEACQSEFNVTDRPDWAASTDDIGENFKCFIKCLVTKMGFVKENGEVDEERMVREMDAMSSHRSAGTVPSEDDIKKTAEKCNILAVDNSCDAVAKVFMCIKKDMQESMH